MEKQKLISVQEYATLCGITAMAVHLRVKSGTLRWARTSPLKLIDINKFPAAMIKKGRRPYRGLKLA